MKIEDFEKASVLKEKFDKIHNRIKNIKKLIKYIQYRIDEFQQGKVNPNNEIKLEFHYDNGWDNQSLDLYLFNDSWEDILNMLKSQLETYNTTFQKLQKEFEEI